VSVQAGRTRADEVGALVAAHDGRVENAPAGPARSDRPPDWSEAATR
jgi:hypothetical protein